MKTNILQYLSYIESDPEQQEHLLQSAENTDLEHRIQDVAQFELLTLQLGLDRIQFEIDWFETLRKTLENENSDSFSQSR